MVAQHQMRIMDETGDIKLMWDPANRDEVELAKEQFEKAKKKGMKAFAVGDDQGKGKMVEKFDPMMRKIIMAFPLQGG